MRPAAIATLHFTNEIHTTTVTVTCVTARGWWVAGG